jgi:hypothetical protein
MQDPRVLEIVKVAVANHRQDVMGATKEAEAAVKKLPEFGEGGRFARVAWGAVRQLAEKERADQGHWRNPSVPGPSDREMYRQLREERTERELEKALGLFRHLAGREPTGEEVAEARRAWETLAPFKAPAKKGKKGAGKRKEGGE